jgi:hypothetical protein
MLNVYKVINDAISIFNYSYKEIMHKIPYQVLMMQLFTHYKSFETTEKTNKGGSLSDLL